MKFLQFLGRTLLGIPVSILLMWPIAGGLPNAVTLIALSIICTAGIGLVIWIPIWWLTGWSILTLVKKFSGNAEPNATSPPDLPKIPREHQAIINFIDVARLTGAPDEEIMTKLRAAGWPGSSIEEALRTISER